jgi:hypothetical protein
VSVRGRPRADHRVPTQLTEPDRAGALTAGAITSRGQVEGLPTVAAIAVAVAVVRRTGRTTHGQLTGFRLGWLLNAVDDV